MDHDKRKRGGGHLYIFLSWKKKNPACFCTVVYPDSHSHPHILVQNKEANKLKSDTVSFFPTQEVGVASSIRCKWLTSLNGIQSNYLKSPPPQTMFLLKRAFCCLFVFSYLKCVSALWRGCFSTEKQSTQVLCRFLSSHSPTLNVFHIPVSLLIHSVTIAAGVGPSIHSAQRGGMKTKCQSSCPQELRHKTVVVSAAERSWGVSAECSAVTSEGGLLGKT